MFDVGFSELLLLAIVALVVLGPEKLPHAARVAGAWVGRIRRTISTMQSEIEREVEAQEIRTRLEKQLREMGGDDFVEAVESERRDLEGSLGEARAALGGAATVRAAQAGGDAIITPSADAPAPSLLAAPGPVLPEAATPPDEVRLDGEQAYREWLATQRIERRIAPPAASKDASA